MFSLYRNNTLCVHSFEIFSKVSCPSGEGEFASLEASDKAKTDGEKAEMTVQVPFLT